MMVHLRRAAAVLVWLGVSGPALLCAQGQTPAPNAKDTNAANLLVIDLNAASQIGHVNFDVPITLQLSLDPDVLRVDVFKADRPRKAACDDAVAFQYTNTWRRFSLGRVPQPPPQPVDTTTKVTAYITADPVDANHYICFKFTVTRTLSATELVEINKSAAEVTDNAFRNGTLAPAGKGRDELLAFRNLLRQVLGVTAPLPSIAVKRDVVPGSMLSASPTPDMLNAFFGFVGTVDNAEQNRVSTVATFRALTQADTPQGAVPSLIRLLNLRIPATATQPYLAAYAQRIATAAQSNATLAERFRAAQAAIPKILSIRDATSADITVGRARAVVLGLNFGEVDPDNLARTWESKPVADRQKIVQQWLTDLQTVRDFVAQTQVDAVNPPFTEAELATVRDALNDAVSQVDRVVGQLAFIQLALAARDKAIRDFAQQIGDRVSADAFVGTNSFADFNSRAIWYMSADIGIASAPDLKSAFPYVGGNIYFRPVNKDAPLSLRGGFGRRFSAMVGATFSTDLTKPGQIENSLGGSRMLLIGAGFRLTDMLRAGGGVVVVKALNPNPLIGNDPSFQSTPFFGLSIDWDAKTTFQNAFSGSAK